MPHILKTYGKSWKQTLTYRKYILENDWKWQATYGTDKYNILPNKSVLFWNAWKYHSWGLEIFLSRNFLDELKNDALFAFRGRRRAPQSAQGEHQGPERLPFWGNMSLCFHNFSSRATGNVPRPLQMISTNPKWAQGCPPDASRSQRRTQKTELPVAEELQKLSIPPELPKRRKIEVRRCRAMRSQ